MPSTFGVSIYSPVESVTSPSQLILSPKSQEHMEEIDALDEEIEDLENQQPLGSPNSLAYMDLVGDKNATDLMHMKKRHRSSLSGSRPSSAISLGGNGRFKLKPMKDLLKQQAFESMNQVRLHETKYGFLHSGAKFIGEQLSARQTYEVSVELKHVDLDNSSACGYIKIKGLTEECSELTTCFDAEIIGSKNPFITAKWDADTHVDQLHWTKFPAFEQYEDDFYKDGFNYNFKNQPYIFMRWKENFLVPDHRVTSVTGASFAGFYYICMEVQTGKISGFYFHQNSEWFQHLKLEPVPENSFGSFEFR